MSNVQGVNVTKYDAETSDTTWIDQGLIKSSIRVWSDVYEAAALAIGQTIGLAQLPDGAVVHGGILYFDALGAGVTLEIGDSTDSARYLSATVCTAAGSALFDAVDGSGYAIGTNAGDGEIIATVGVGAATGTVRSVVLYTN
jgi:hypothetical protein